jgi:hypothetical protein
VQISYPDSNRIGRFWLPFDVIQNGADAPMLKALFGLCVVLHIEAHENGRGMTYYAASDELFQPILDGAEIPEYRLEVVYDRAFENPERERARVNSGKFGFVAIRNFILRVPPAQLVSKPATPLH